MNTVTSSDKSEVVQKAFNNACEALKFDTNERSKLLSVDESALIRNVEVGFAPGSKQSELQLHFIKLYRSLFAISGGDTEFMVHWFHTKNEMLNGIPARLCLSNEGLTRVIQYLSGIQR